MAVDHAALPRLTINLEIADTPDRYCTEYATWLHVLYTRDMGAVVPGYSRYGTMTSVAVLPATYEEWFEQPGYGNRRTTIRKAFKLGYTFQEIDRDCYLADIQEINRSMPERQGRPMGESYQRDVAAFGPLPDQPCPKHRLATYGVLKDGRLVAYTWVYQTGEMFLLSTLLGHGDHLKNGVMYLLIAGVVRDLITTAGAKYAVYERHSSGTDGLRFFKEQMGFHPCMVTFLRGDEKPPTRWDLLRQRLSPYEHRARIVGRRASRAVRVRLYRPARVRLGRIRRRVFEKP